MAYNRDYFKRWQAKNREARNAYSLEYCKAHRDRIRDREQAKLLWAPAKPRPQACEICGKESKLSLDHCHLTEKFRGWLCSSCNLGLGQFNDSATLLKKAAAYLEKVYNPPAIKVRFNTGVKLDVNKSNA